MRTLSLSFLSVVTLLVATPRVADAFCGFYVSGADAAMFNNATQVVLMREGTRTVLSMQNNYQGPPENFAMVVPVPQVLQKDNVKTLDAGIFTRIDQLAAPRLVEYWEQDPCAIRRYDDDPMTATVLQESGPPTESTRGGELGVTIEAQFKVGEYEIVILSAKDSTGLDTWLRQQAYQIPAGAEPLLRPYVESGSKFFVAKVDTTKVTFKDGMVKLSPLRFHYDSEEFSLPIRLGLINSGGTQDLIVHILAKGTRYGVSNYKNVTIPTNLDVRDDARTRFGEFYAALFDATLEKNPGAVITEYSWDASTCDPCPTPALTRNELATLGEDVLYQPAAATPGQPARAVPPPARWTGFVLTRLHARYGKSGVSDDLVFKQAPGIAGGRERRPQGKLEHGSQSSSVNNFQARYAIRHAWTGAIECENPVRGRWGGPPSGVRHSNSPVPATDLAFAPRGNLELAKVVRSDIPELQIASAGDTPGMPTKTSADTAKQTTKPPATAPIGPTKPAKKNKGCSAVGTNDGSGWLIAMFGLLWITRRRGGTIHSVQNLPISR